MKPNRNTLGSYEHLRNVVVILLKIMLNAGMLNSSAGVECGAKCGATLQVNGITSDQDYTSGLCMFSFDGVLLMTV